MWVCCRDARGELGLPSRQLPPLSPPHTSRLYQCHLGLIGQHGATPLHCRDLWRKLSISKDLSTLKNNVSGFLTEISDYLGAEEWLERVVEVNR